ncbi:cytochrome c oxidase subunit II [Dinoroseobacter shibae]|jgi:cytochrome c oxidase subunit 2|nr:cytochrome c oxidase subunit II [Dinoroseobacter shibae]URF47818.1 cytochrome c oxidase subunit II [Dinoroseobacter shibae]URF52128.1 cytochrome c oxidase subunit II [Dinoroseobacter shibae]
MANMTRITGGLAAGMAALGAPAFADNREGMEIIGQPIPGGIGFQPAATELARELQWLDGLLLVIITAIVLFVTALIAWTIVRHNAKSNPEPARFSHNTPIEITWTVVPILILVFIGAFSLPVLFKQQEIPEAEVTIKATGYQWFWGYEYPEHDFGFESFMLARDELAEHGYEDEHFLLATDTAMVVPVDTTVVVQVTAADVIHSWTIPAFGVKQDGIPGRLAELWFSAEKEGIYFGQCSELCGKDHAYMPITVKVVSKEEYARWLDTAIAQYNGTPRTVDYAAK